MGKKRKSVLDIVEIIENVEVEEVDQFFHKNEEDLKKKAHTDRSNIISESDDDGSAKLVPSTSEAVALVSAEFSELAECENSPSDGEKSE
mmetsp:Transcript_25019/g.25471  ORF Transcript_25019/g.25471 Transcript_25019/m.25471 type:complete len:90 (-) Transcript_25019:315-584(-)